MKNVLSVLVLWLLALTASAESAAEAESSGADPLALMVEMFRWEGMLASIVVIIVVGALLRFEESMVNKLGKVFADKRLILKKISAFFHFAVYVTTIVIVVMLSFKISKEILVILSGTGAVALGFALKDLAASLMAGVMILFDRPFQVGDRIHFGGEYGDVTAIGLRSVKLRTLDDSVVTIPNNLFLSEVTSCGNYGVLDMQIMVDFYIGIDQDVVRAREIIHEVAANTRFIHLPKPIQVIVEQIVLENTVALRLRLKAYVLDTRYEKSFETDVTLHVMKLFAEEKIQPPAALHRQLQVGESQPGEIGPEKETPAQQ